MAEKGREFDKQRKEKKFNSDTISSSSFNFQNYNNIEKGNKTGENKEFVIGNKNCEEYVNKYWNEKEDEK